MKCALCTNPPPQPPGVELASERKCAFEPLSIFGQNSLFSSDNWHCETMLRLRALAQEGGNPDDIYSGAFASMSFRQGDESIAVLETKIATDQTAWIVMTWYKERGRTSQAWVFEGDEPPRPLSIDVAEQAVALCEERLKQ